MVDLICVFRKLQYLFKLYNCFVCFIYIYVDSRCLLVDSSRLSGKLWEENKRLGFKCFHLF